jgi:hypothetical protein
MKKFIKYLILFSIPVLVFLISVELYCRTQTTFAIKKNYVEKNLGTIETLILGSSHSQNGINPEFLKTKSCNLAFGGQPIAIDYFLLEKYMAKMKNLKTVLLEVSPHRFYNELNPNEWNGHVYSNLYDIDYKVEEYSVKNYSFALADVNYFSTIFVANLNPKIPKPKLNKFGFMINDFQDRFSKLKNDSLKIQNSFKMNNKFNNQENFETNTVFLNKIIEKCQQNSVKIILMGTPLYRTYSTKIPLKIKKQHQDLISKIIHKFGIQYYDFSNSKRFNLKDFKNDNHLNPNGAKKFTIIIDSIVNNPIPLAL